MQGKNVNGEFDRQKQFTGTGPVREGFELDLTALQAYMEKHVEGFSGTLSLEQFRGGQSNPTYRISAGGKKYVLRRKPSGKLLKSAHAVDREYRVVSALGKTGVPVARTYCMCEDDSVIGSWFYIMDFVDGRIFWTLPSTPHEERSALFSSMNETIAALHTVDYKAIGLEGYGKQGNYCSRQISIWKKQYRASVEEKYPAMEKLIEWLEENQPDEEQVSIVHGDYRIDNLIFHPTEPRVAAILDWELSTLGNPLADFAYHCMSWSLPEKQFKALGGMGGYDPVKMNFPSEKEYIREYFKRTGNENMENWNYYAAFSFFKISGISFGIMGRLRDGTATSKNAKNLAAIAEPLADIGYARIAGL